jgi:hypothetical protein
MDIDYIREAVEMLRKCGKSHFVENLLKSGESIMQPLASFLAQRFPDP